MTAEGRPLDAERWAGAVDAVGARHAAIHPPDAPDAGPRSPPRATPAAPKLETTVFPFILRGVALLGMDSVTVPIARRRELWDRLATDLRPRDLGAHVTEVTLDELDGALDAIVAGSARGRWVVRVGGLGSAPRHDQPAEQPPVERLVSVDHPADGEPLEGGGLDRRPIEVVEPVIEERELLRIVADEPVDPVAQDLGDRARPARQDRRAAGQRLDDDQPERLGPGRRHERRPAAGDEPIALGRPSSSPRIVTSARSSSGRMTASW